MTALSSPLLAASLFAAAPSPDHLLFRSERIYAVLTVVLIIWLGILLHLLWLNRRVNKLEEELRQHEAPLTPAEDTGREGA